MTQNPVTQQKFRHPRVAFRKGEHKRVRAGHPWAFSNEIEMDAAAKTLPPGSVVTLVDAGGEALGTAHFNPHTLIAARLLSRSPDVAVDEEFMATRLRSALDLRARLFAKPYYRLIHAEADGLPGLVIDRFADVAVIQPNTAGMNEHVPLIASALKTLFAPTAVILRGDSGARGLEGLASEVRCIEGAVDGPVALEENGATFFADLVSGQKTGWFFDQRDNRAFMASLAPGLSVLDLYTHTGGFGVAAAHAGATQVTMVDSSAPALVLAAEAAQKSGVAGRTRFERSEVYPFLEAARGQQWNMVIADPPAFVKSRKDLKAGLQGYRKLARLCAAVTAPGGFLFIASCSHNAPLEEFLAAVSRGVADTGREARILRTAGASADHPVHPALPETAYLKAVVLNLN